MTGIVDESKMYRCDTPIIFKVTNFNWPASQYRTTQSVIRVDEIQSYETLWGAVYPAQSMDWKVRRMIRRFIMPVPNVDYTKYELSNGQLCPCDKHLVGADAK